MNVYVMTILVTLAYAYPRHYVLPMKEVYVETTSLSVDSVQPVHVNDSVSVNYELLSVSSDSCNTTENYMIHLNITSVYKSVRVTVEYGNYSTFIHSLNVKKDVVKCKDNKYSVNSTSDMVISVGSYQIISVGSNVLDTSETLIVSFEEYDTLPMYIFILCSYILAVIISVIVIVGIVAYYFINKRKHSHAQNNEDVPIINN